MLLALLGPTTFGGRRDPNTYVFDTPSIVVLVVLVLLGVALVVWLFRARRRKPPPEERRGPRER